MSELTKKLLKDALCFLIIIAVIFGFGFIIGGEAKIVFFLVMAALYIGVLFIIKGKELFRKENILLIVFVVAIGCFINMLLYTTFNRAFDFSKPDKTYYSEVIDYPGSAPFEDIMWFKDPQGNTKESTDFSLLSEKDFEKGGKIFVEEYKGLFDIEHYEITKG